MHLVLASSNGLRCAVLELHPMCCRRADVRICFIDLVLALQAINITGNYQSGDVCIVPGCIMNREADLLLGPDQKRSPLRVRIPSNPYANESSSTPSKFQTHLSFRESIYNRCNLLASTAVLLLLLTVLYYKVGGVAPQQYSSPVSGHALLHNMTAMPTGMDAALTEQTPHSNEDIEDALAATSRFTNQQQAPQASISKTETSRIFEELQPQTKLSTEEEMTRAVVVAQHREDVAWLNDLPATVQRFVYQAENSTAERPVRVNQGETAMYLQYIVEQYNNLPDAVAFVHAHQVAPHMPDKLNILNQLRWDAFEYANLRYTNVTYDLWGKWTGDWLCPQNPSKPPPSDEIIWDELRVNQSQLFADVWRELFEGPIGPMPQYVHSPCCAEFVVSRQRIQARPLSFYEDCLTWLEATSSERYWAGRIFEYVWHIVFGETALYFAPEECELLHC